jgi:hypothetical protein
VHTPISADLRSFWCHRSAKSGWQAGTVVAKLGRWTLRNDGELLGDVIAEDVDQPWLVARWVATEAFGEVAALFDEDLRMLQASELEGLDDLWTGFSPPAFASTTLTAAQYPSSSCTSTLLRLGSGTKTNRSAPNSPPLADIGRYRTSRTEPTCGVSRRPTHAPERRHCVETMATRGLRPPSGSTWEIWQVDGHAQFNGIVGNVDLDVMRLGPAKW